MRSLATLRMSCCEEAQATWRGVMQALQSTVTFEPTHPTPGTTQESEEALGDSSPAHSSLPN